MEEEFVIEKKPKRVLIISMIAILAPLVGLIYWKVAHSLHGTAWVLKEASDMSFHGRVDSIYFDDRNHHTETLILSDRYRYWLYPEWGSLVAKGDSLAKDTGSLKVIVYKRGKQTNILDYKELVKDFK